MNTKTREPVKIHRDRKCGCGCKGTDPWHRRTMTRVVREITKIEGVDLRGNGCTRLVNVVRGVAHMPWGEQEVFGQIVVMDDGRQRGREWHFDR